MDIESFVVLSAAGMVWAAIVVAIVLLVLHLIGYRNYREFARVRILCGIVAAGLVFAMFTTPYRTEYETPVDTGRDMGSVEPEGGA